MCEGEGKDEIALSLRANAPLLLAMTIGGDKSPYKKTTVFAAMPLCCPNGLCPTAGGMLSAGVMLNLIQHLFCFDMKDRS